MVFYESFYEAIKGLDSDNFKECVCAVMEYALHGEEVEMSGVAKLFFTMAKPQIDANNKRYENGKRGASAGIKGGRPKKETPAEQQENPFEEIAEPQENPKETPKQETESPKEKDKDKVKDKVKVKDIFAPTENRSMQSDPFEEFADVAAIPLNDGTEWRMPMETYKEFVKLYPNVDVKQQMNAMRGWVISNPTRRKTKTGVKRFINNWLSSEQNKPARTGGRSQSVPDYMLAQPVEQPAQTDITGISEVKDLLAQMGGKA